MAERAPYDEARAKRLNDLIADRGISKSGFAESVGTSAANAREWRRGAKIGATSLDRVADFFGVNPRWLDSGEGEKHRPETDLLNGLQRLEREVRQQGRALEEIRKVLTKDPRWPRVEARLNFLSDQLQRVAIQAQDEDEQGESQQWSPIDLSPEEPAP